MQPTDPTRATEPVISSYAEPRITAKLMSIIILAFGVFMFVLLPSSGPSACNPKDERWIVLLLGTGFTGFGLINAYSTFLGRVTWNKESVTYRTLGRKKITSKWADVHDCGGIGWVNLGYIIFEGAPTLYFSHFYKNVEALYTKTEKALEITRPELFYVAATRENVAESETCGCLICAEIFMSEEITDWKNSVLREGHEMDVAMCPHCNKASGVMCDRGEHDMSEAALAALFKDLLKDCTAEEKLERNQLRAKYSTA